MSIPITLPVNARPTITSNIFSAVFNVPTLNRYDFTNVAGNQRQTVLRMNQNCVYVIERACFSLDIPEGEFQSAIDSTVSVPVIKFETLKTRQMIFARKQPFINYVDNLELYKFVTCDQKDDEILVSFEAVFTQTPAMIGILNLKAFLQLNIYEVQSTDWVTQFVKPKSKEGSKLRYRGR